MKFRVIHSQKGAGPIMLQGVAAGPPLDDRKYSSNQVRYIPHYYKRLVRKESGEVVVEEDRSLPGYVDLTPTDNVLASAVSGQIRQMVRAGDVDDLVIIPTGGIPEPQIEGFTYDPFTQVLVIKGQHLVSYPPYPVVVVVEGTEYRGDGITIAPEGYLLVGGVGAEPDYVGIKVNGEGYKVDRAEGPVKELRNGYWGWGWVLGWDGAMKAI